MVKVAQKYCQDEVWINVVWVEWAKARSMAMHRPACMVASYPGLLTPAFVTCSTNTGEGLVKLSHMQ